MITWTTDTATAITSCRLTEAQRDAAKVLGGPREVGGICEIELDGALLWGWLFGAGASGLRLSPIVHPSYAEALRAKIAISYGPDATAALIDRDLAEREASDAAWAAKGFIGGTVKVIDASIDHPDHNVVHVAVGR